MSKKCIALCLAVLLLICIGIWVYAEEKSANRVAPERLIVQIDVSSWIQETFKVSPNSKRVAYAARVGNKRFVVVDGKEGKKYDGVGASGPIFSPNSFRLAYVAIADNKYLIVVDGNEGKPYDSVVTVEGGRIIFDFPDSLRYLATKGSGIYLVEERIK